MFGYTFQWKQVFARLPQMLDGALVTMQIAVLSMVIGIALVVPLIALNFFVHGCC